MRWVDGVVVCRGGARVVRGGGCVLAVMGGCGGERWDVWGAGGEVGVEGGWGMEMVGGW